MKIGSNFESLDIFQAKLALLNTFAACLPNNSYNLLLFHISTPDEVPHPRFNGFCETLRPYVNSITMHHHTQNHRPNQLNSSTNRNKKISFQAASFIIIYQVCGLYVEILKSTNEYRGPKIRKGGKAILNPSSPNIILCLL